MRTRTVLLAIALCAPAAGAQRLALDPTQTRVWFDASASMGSFRGTAQRFSGWAEAPDTVGWSGASGRVEVEAASFGTGIALRNRHLRSHLQAERFPRIVFELERVVPQPERGARAVSLVGSLTIRDVTRRVEIPATIASASPVTLDGRLETRFTDWGMRPPSQMAGMARVRDPLVLHFHAVFR